MWPDALATARLRLLFCGTMDGSQIRTTFNYQLSDISGTTKPIFDVVTAFFTDVQWTSLQAAFLAAVPSDYRLDYITWQWSQNNITYLQQRRQVNLVGSLDPAYTANIQTTIVRRPQQATREGVGAIRLPAPANTFTTANGELTQGYKSIVQALADLMDDPIVCVVDGTGTFTFTPGTYRRTSPTFASFTPTFATFIQPEARIIRRRTARLGI